MLCLFLANIGHHHKHALSSCSAPAFSPRGLQSSFRSCCKLRARWQEMSTILLAKKNSGRSYLFVTATLINLNTMFDMCSRPPRRPEPSRATSSDHSRAHLLNHSPPQHAGNGIQSMIYILCQALKLKVVYGIASKRPGRRVSEETKVAIYKSRWHAVLRCTVHAIPVLAALALVVLNCMQIYIGGELEGRKGQDSEKLRALQFAGKLHELMMLTSLGTIIFTYIRRELVRGTGIPFGALFVGFQIDSISLLWSPEFLGTIYQKWSANRTKKIILVTSILVCTLLGVSVGPSSANLMQPRLDLWPAGGTSYWINTTSAVLSPQVLSDSPSLEHCAVDTGDAACPYGDWQMIQQEYHAFWPRLVPMGSMPLHISIPSPYSLRAMQVFQRSTSDAWGAEMYAAIWGSKFSLATVPTAPIADGLAEVARLWSRAMAATNHHHFERRKDVTFTTQAPQSTVYARCSENIVDNSTDFASLQLNFPVLSSITYDKGEGNDATIYQKGFHLDTTAVTIGAVEDGLTPGTTAALTFFDESGMLDATNSTLLAVATFPSSSNDTSLFYCCSIDTRLTKTDLVTTRNEYKLVVGLPPDWESGTVNTSLQKIMPSAAWARYVNPAVPNENATAFSKIASTAGMWNTSLPSAPYYFPAIVESILTTMVANGMARASYNTSMITKLKGANGDGNQWIGRGWFAYLFPSHLFGKGSSIFDISPAEQAAATEFQMSAAAQGYSYSTRGTLQKAAIAVLILYSFLAAGHFAYSWITGWASTSWETLPEIAALAMNSRRTEALHNTGAGIATVGVFEETVKVRARDANNLEFVFDDTPHNMFLVRENRPYA